MQLADAEEWKRSMIGFFVSYKLPFYAVQSITNRIWKSHGLEKTMVLPNGFMVFRFASVPQMEEVLARGPWMFGGKTILLQQWKPGFKFDRNKIKSIPVWARLQGLPFSLWNKQGLSMAASMIGHPIACDEATLHGSRVEYARVCIEIEADVPLIYQFQVASSLTEVPITVDVIYEWKPSRCDTCKVFGHSCRAQEKTKGKDVEPLVATDQKTEGLGITNGTNSLQPIAMEVDSTSQRREEDTRSAPMKDSSALDKTNAEKITTEPKTGGAANGKKNKEDSLVAMIRDEVQEGPFTCTTNKMVSLSSETKGKGKELVGDTAGSSSGSQSTPSQVEINSPTPKRKKKKKGGKNRYGGHSP